MKTKRLEEVYDWLSDKDLLEGCWIHYKGHNIPKDVLLKELEDDWLGHVYYEKDNVEEEIQILKIEEDYYYTHRFCDGQDAKDEGYNHWIDFVKPHEKKKTYGKSTNVYFKVKPKGGST